MTSQATLKRRNAMSVLPYVAIVLGLSACALAIVTVHNKAGTSDGYLRAVAQFAAYDANGLMTIASALPDSEHKVKRQLMELARRKVEQAEKTLYFSDDKGETERVIERYRLMRASR